MKQHPDVQELRKLLGFYPPLDGLMCSLEARPMVDFPVLETILQKYWAAEYKAGMSQDQFITQQFGAHALELLNKMV